MSAFCGFISFHFSLLWLHLLSCRLFVVSSSLHVWPFLAFGPSCPFILTFFLPKNATGLDLRPALEKRAFLRKRFKTKISLLIFFCLVDHHFLPFGLFVSSCPSFWHFVPSFASILAFCGVISFRFGLLWLHLLSCRLFVALAPFILAFCGFICFHVGFLWLHLLFIFGLLWLYFLSLFAFCGFMSFHFGLLRLYPLSFCAFWWLHFFSFWLFVASCPFIVAFCAFICFHVGFLWRYLLPFWPFVLSFAFMSAFCGIISFHFSLLWLHLLSCRLFVASSSLHFWPFVALFPFIFCLLWLYFLSFFAFCGFICFHFGFFVVSCLFIFFCGLYFLHFGFSVASFPCIVHVSAHAHAKNSKKTSSF